MYLQDRGRIFRTISFIFGKYADAGINRVVPNRKIIKLKTAKTSCRPILFLFCDLK